MTEGVEGLHEVKEDKLRRVSLFQQTGYVFFPKGKAGQTAPAGTEALLAK